MASAQLYWGRMAASILRLVCYIFPDIDWGFVFVDDFCWILRSTTVLATLLALGVPLRWKKTIQEEPGSYSFTGRDWWSPLMTAWQKMGTLERFQGVDYIIPTVPKDYTGVLARPSAADRALRWLKAALPRHGGGTGFGATKPPTDTRFHLGALTQPMAGRCPSGDVHPQKKASVDQGQEGHVNNQHSTFHFTCCTFSKRKVGALHWLHTVSQSAPTPANGEQGDHLDKMEPTSW
eukprot:s78_g27.t1